MFLETETFEQSMFIVLDTFNITFLEIRPQFEANALHCIDESSNCHFVFPETKSKKRKNCGVFAV